MLTGRRLIVAWEKSAVLKMDTQVHLEGLSLVVQGQTVRQFCDRAANLWAEAVQTLPDCSMRFALNSVTNTLPHNANLHLWEKKPSPTCPRALCPERQTFQHVLNHCETALEKGTYSERHDDILTSLYSFVSSHLLLGHRVTVDLPGEELVRLPPRCGHHMLPSRHGDLESRLHCPN